MQLRRFTADSTPAALGAVRLALGEDAIILANRRVGDQVEIIATEQMDDGFDLADVSIENVSQAAVSGNRSSNERSVKTAVANESSSIDSLSNNISDDQVSLSNFDARSVSVGDGSVKTDTKTAPREHDQSSAKLYSVAFSSASANNSSSARSESASSRASTQFEAPATLDNIIVGFKQALEEQSAQLKAELAGVIATEREQTKIALETQGTHIDDHFKALEIKLWGNTAPNRTAHLEGLFALGIGAELAIQLVERAKSDASVEDSLRQSFALLKSTLPVAVDKTFTVPGVTVMSGPPGSGKTTALVKMAAQHVKSSGRDSIVIICADTRRIGAFEELQAYGRLLGVPTVHAHDKSELGSLLDAFTHKQLVLIDHTLPLVDGAVELPPVLQKPDNADSVRHLFTLSAGTQSAAVDALLAQHCQGRDIQCVLTQLDTGARLGELFNPIVRHHVPIAYWSDSASVQVPLQKADASILVATAAAMSRRIPQSADDQWLSRLIQPSDRIIEGPLVSGSNKEVSVL